MHTRPLRSAIALSMGALLAFAGSVAADTARADGDVTTPAVETIANLLPFAPGEERSVDIGIVLTCTGTAHVDPGQTVTAIIDSWNAPLDGAVVSVTDGTVGPAPADWTPDGVSCPLPARMFSTGTPSVVTLRAPTTPGTGYLYSLMYHRTIEPFGANDAGAIRQLTAIDIVLDVVVNTAPILTLPTVAGGGTIEANATGGWTADWSGLGATDAEDNPYPTPGCIPVAGTVLPLGSTSVTCSVMDSGGMIDFATFNVFVADRTDPTLTGMPANQSLTTADPSGTTLNYTNPSATDVVDAAPTVGCLPASGEQIGLGTTIVECTATDDAGNTAEGTFSTTVTYVPVNTPPTLTLPTVASGGAVEANTTGGWTADWAGLGATDAEDTPDPTPSCIPAAGTVLSIGTTSVICSVNDNGGMTASGSFAVTVVDTTDPTLTGMPANQSLTTTDPTGTTLTYTNPSATDIADDAPTVGCLPASGEHIGPGTTVVTCTATDDSGHSAEGAFSVTVTYVATQTASATWGEPIAGNGSTFVANKGRNVPVKVQLFVDGEARTSGAAILTITPCTGGTPVVVDLTYSSGRWNASLDTGDLAGTCHTVAASIDGLAAGSFRLELRGAEPTKTKAPATAGTQPATASEGSTAGSEPGKAAAKELAKAAKAAEEQAKQMAKDAKDLAKDAKEQAKIPKGKP